MQRFIKPFIGLFSFLFLIGCTEEYLATDFDLNYDAQLKIEGDFYPQNLGKSVLRIDRTFTISDTMSLENAHIMDAEAVLLRGSDTLSTLSWADSASSYIFFNFEDYQPDGPPDFDSLAAAQDTQSYGGYKLDRVDFNLFPGVTYTLVVNVDGIDYTTEFIPEEPIELLNVVSDSVVACECGVGGIGEFGIVHATMSIDTAVVIWPEDPEANFYTVYFHQLNATPQLMPQTFAYPGPILSLQGNEPGEYDIIIGTMNDTFYRHYYLSDFPLNHETRNFFDNGALGYAGTLSEIYLRVNLVPPGIPVEG
jgi:hypothetical protein